MSKTYENADREADLVILKQDDENGTADGIFIYDGQEIPIEIQYRYTGSDLITAKTVFSIQGHKYSSDAVYFIGCTGIAPWSDGAFTAGDLSISGGYAKYVNDSYDDKAFGFQMTSTTPF